MRSMPWDYYEACCVDLRIGGIWCGGSMGKPTSDQKFGWIRYVRAAYLI